ncbi:MAG: M56 family metallopeptidase, partial [Bacteroidota bacterium]
LVVRQFLRIFKLIIYSSNERREGLTLVHTDEDVPPFAFFRYLVINPENYQGEALHQIIVHEKVHIRQHHYLDILLAEFLRIVCWYNPAVWLLNGLLKMNLEYIADREVLSAGIDRKSYQYQLLDMSVRGQSLRLTTPMNYSPIKMRISMMNTKKSSFLARLKYALLFPICGFALMVIAPVQAQAVEVNPQSTVATAITLVGTIDTSSNVATATSVSDAENSALGTARTFAAEAVATPPNPEFLEEDIYFVIRPNTKRKSLIDAQELLAEKGIIVKYHNMNFNDGLLTAISVSITSNNFNGNLSHDPLDGPLVFYDLRIGERKTGFEYGTPRNVSLKQRNIIEGVSGLFIRNARGGVQIRGSAHID